MKIKILFLCTGNSSRSLMAEGWARHLKYDRIEAASAGVETHGLNPLAVKVMVEVGVDISNQHSKTTDELADREFDYVITVCGHADQNCPFFRQKTGSFFTVLMICRNLPGKQLPQLLPGRWRKTPI